MKPDIVYDVPLLRSLQQQLCDRHILKEVLYVHTHSTHVLTHTIHTYMHKHIGTIKQNNLNNSYYENHYTVCEIAFERWADTLSGHDKIYVQLSENCIVY